MSNNIEIEIVTDLELKYYAIFWKKENIAYIVIGNPNFAPYKNICFEIMEVESKKIVYYWYDNEKTTLQEIVENIEKAIDYFITY
ncbi:hypothetical protein EGX98_10805 [Fusobacterium necrophorum]|uniref:Uncharacterized protein n=2 Tax=Fusobacterium necrophorum TaxID=859 RepID=A0AB73BXZ2_9FUSO|nr:hypothetical protein [Fusobacterium necrophorum]AYZ74470.1 hypothetical protein EGX98_10805 [Fusobacterium necrophorum]AZW09645.1 hypothetical protein EO219_08765 [Fusobacterium necrophorum subsp. necrophorum]KDE62148.1 hypothetical protein FUSO5_10205 [Fusobacterium necrophorum BFTR-1]KDE64578.1 hypothetical protein FUSO3_02565 [Fusobacterium necrophorum BL]KDE65397.1 hypothetical protein FUSO4_06510 [Fusobacterium necrophorum DJ-1]